MEKLYHKIILLLILSKKEDAALEKLISVLDDIRVVSVDDMPQPVGDDTSVKTDRVSRFCKGLHAELRKQDAFKVLSDVSEDAYASRPKNARGDRSYTIVMDGDTDFENLVVRCVGL